MGTHICQYEIIQTSAAPVCGGTGAIRVAQQMAAVETINQLNAQARLDPSWRAHAVGFRLPVGACGARPGSTSALARSIVVGLLGGK